MRCIGLPLTPCRYAVVNSCSGIVGHDDDGWKFVPSKGRENRAPVSGFASLLALGTSFYLVSTSNAKAATILSYYVEPFEVRRWQDIYYCATKASLRSTPFTVQ